MKKAQLVINGFVFDVKLKIDISNIDYLNSSEKEWHRSIDIYLKKDFIFRDKINIETNNIVRIILKNKIISFDNGFITNKDSKHLQFQIYENRNLPHIYIEQKNY